MRYQYNCDLTIDGYRYPPWIVIDCHAGPEYPVIDRHGTELNARQSAAAKNRAAPQPVSEEP